MPRQEALRIEALLFDLDDTLLTHGTLTRDAYDALWMLHDAKIDLVAVTGRPCGWGEVIARQWPVLGVVTENGGALLHREGPALIRSIRGDHRERLDAIVAEVRARFPEVELSDDVDARRTDVTFDVGERHRLDPARIEELRRFVIERGARSTVSSVHLHATFQGDDKASGAFRMLRERRGIDAGRARACAAFVGDSGNDAPCFAAFSTTIGVANVARWVPSLSVPPRYVTEAPMGAGFVELARQLVLQRQG
ncbi:MAG: HAD-IIB family hydrolase [Polyangiales bacterium]